MATKQNVTVAKKNTSTTKALSLTDPHRKLTREEWANLSKEQKAERKTNRQALRGPMKQRYAKLVARYVTKFERLEKTFSNTSLNVHTATETLRGIASGIDELPDTWVPAGRQLRFAFTIGQHVQLVEARRANYEGLLGADDDINALKVMQVAGRNVVVKTPKGVRFIIDAKHVQAAG